LWRIGGADGKDFLRAVEPYLIDKREQAVLILNMGNDHTDVVQVRCALRAMKGNQGLATFEAI
jgi:hypothetical protein